MTKEQQQARSPYDEGNFFESISKQINAGNHAEYLQAVLDKYKHYKEVFNNIFTDKNNPSDTYSFRVKYLLKNSVWRDFEIHGTQDFNDLAEAVIDSMGWNNDHMHGFDLPNAYGRDDDPMFTGSSLSFFAPGWEDDPHPTFKTDEIKIADIDYDKVLSFKFIFDFGDGHQFDIIHTGRRPFTSKDEHAKMPALTELHGEAPEQYPDVREYI
jgi:hypothetical protein